MHNKAGKGNGLRDVKCLSLSLLFTTLATSEKTWKSFLQNGDKGTKNLVCADL